LPPVIDKRKCPKICVFRIIFGGVAKILYSDGLFDLRDNNNLSYWERIGEHSSLNLDLIKEVMAKVHKRGFKLVSTLLLREKIK